LKTGEIGPNWLSKVAGAALPAFQERIVLLEICKADFKTSELALTGCQKISVQLREICHPIGAKDLNSPVLKSFSQNQKLLC
jgi:hypothetical protein